MLFDLGSGRKKQAVRIVYAALAGLFLIGFVGFGVGTNIGGGGIADIFTDDSGDIEQSQFSKDADELAEQVKEDPQNKELLTQLISLRFSAGQALMQVDESGVPTLTEGAEQEFDDLASTWEQYLATKPPKVDLGAAISAASAFSILGQFSTSQAEAKANWTDAADAQEIVAAQRTAPGRLSQLAAYRYFAGDFAAGDRTADRAKAMVNNPRARKNLAQQLKSYRQQAKAYVAQLRAAAQQQDQGNENGAPGVPENPLGDLGGGGNLSPTPAP